MSQEKASPLFSNSSVITAGSIAVVLIAGGVIFKGAISSETTWPDFFAGMTDSATVQVINEPPEPRMMFRSPDGVYTVEYGEEYAAEAANATEEGVLIHLSELMPPESNEAGIIVRPVADQELEFAALRAATEDAVLSDEVATGSAFIKKLQNIELNSYPAVEYLAERDEPALSLKAADASEAGVLTDITLFKFAQVVLINADKAGFFEVINVAGSREQLQEQAEEHARVLSSFTVL